MNENLVEKVKCLSCWKSEVLVEPLKGGITNVNFKVTESEQSYVVRLGGDIPEHLVMRSNEMVASEAAETIGVSPQVVHKEPGVLVIHFIDGNVLEASDVRVEENLNRIIDLIKHFHTEMPKHFNGYTIMFWVFQVLRHYRNILEKHKSIYMDQLPELMAITQELECAVGPVEIVFGHNDLLPANFIDDGKKIWLIDFDYAGFNSPLFDLANLASNNELSLDQEKSMLTNYFNKTIDDEQWRSYSAMKCASLLRETMWSMVSEVTSNIDFDYGEYTRENMSRFQEIFAGYKREFNSI